MKQQLQRIKESTERIKRGIGGRPRYLNAGDREDVLKGLSNIHFAVSELEALDQAADAAEAASREGGILGDIQQVLKARKQLCLEMGDGLGPAFEDMKEKAKDILERLIPESREESDDLSKALRELEGMEIGNSGPAAFDKHVSPILRKAYLDITKLHEEEDEEEDLMAPPLQWRGVSPPKRTEKECACGGCSCNKEEDGRDEIGITIKKLYTELDEAITDLEAIGIKGFGGRERREELFGTIVDMATSIISSVHPEDVGESISKAVAIATLRNLSRDDKDLTNNLTLFTDQVAPVLGAIHADLFGDLMDDADDGEDDDGEEDAAEMAGYLSGLFDCVVSDLEDSNKGTPERVSRACGKLEDIIGAMGSNKGARAVAGAIEDMVSDIRVIMDGDDADEHIGSCLVLARSARDMFNTLTVAVV